MNQNYYQLIQQQYRNSGGDSTRLFETIVWAAGEIGMDKALEYLEQCVIQKRLAWLEKNLATLERSGNPVEDGYRLFYELYLGVSVDKDGEVVVATDRKMVTRWWNKCPTLEACQKLGLDTRVVCRKAYHVPVQVFLSSVDSRLRFDRDYAALRPHAPYCEEIITLE